MIQWLPRPFPKTSTKLFPGAPLQTVTAFVVLGVMGFIPAEQFVPYRHGKGNTVPLSAKTRLKKERKGMKGHGHLLRLKY